MGFLREESMRVEDLIIREILKRQDAKSAKIRRRNSPLSMSLLPKLFYLRVLALKSIFWGRVLMGISP